ncbi:MAG: glycosyl hydrolase 43 family protein [Cyclobacteriaceae bacterium]|nr:glycosyl hydrolase 43 family protein [Cyclobacteriaceae bacterium]
MRLGTGFLFWFTFTLAIESIGQSVSDKTVSETWVADRGDGTYKNPILHADYSDPDVCRVGDDFFLVSSSFDAVPGLPILQSKDLVNWKLVGHALKRQPPIEIYEKTQHGNGVWAPSIRYHNNEFYIYYPDPDFGIYLTKAKNATGPWSEPVLVQSGKGLIDPCPLWDDDGSAYLVHAYAGSRAGIKSILVVKRMNANGTAIVDAGTIVYDGHETDPTIEGPKLYKRNGYYYIFAPAGGVSTGWQCVLRSKNIYGPYERRVVMDQGSTIINGPHQGAWVDTQTGEDWFIHFQDKKAFGRVVHLQPMKWINDWPVIGLAGKNNKGEPVLSYKKPNVGRSFPVASPDESDEFSTSIGLQWQWQANHGATWSFINQTEGALRLYAQKVPEQAKNYWDVPNILLQKFPSEEFVVTTKMTFHPNQKLEDERAGLIVMGQSYAGVSLRSKKDGTYLVYSVCKDAVKGNAEREINVLKVTTQVIYFRVKISRNEMCVFGYSLDGKKFVDFDDTFQAEPGKWIGAKVGLFCTQTTGSNDAGYADFDWFRISKL